MPSHCVSNNDVIGATEIRKINNGGQYGREQGHSQCALLICSFARPDLSEFKQNFFGLVKQCCDLNTLYARVSHKFVGGPWSGVPTVCQQSRAT